MKHMTWWRIAFVFALTLVLSLPAVAYNTAPEVDAREASIVEMASGHSVWLPGINRIRTEGWMGFNCIGSECKLLPARLSVRRTTLERKYDGKVAGQTLSFSLKQPVKGDVILWLKPTAKSPWLRRGSVATYTVSTSDLKSPLSQGTLEIAVDLPDGKEAHLLPLLKRPDNSTSRSELWLQLRAFGKRQILHQVGTCSGMLSRDYLLWAGDLDGDGLPDFVVDGESYAGGPMLYLSSIARGGDLVGVAGHALTTPDDTECDGMGWLSGIR